MCAKNFTVPEPTSYSDLIIVVTYFVSLFEQCDIITHESTEQELLFHEIFQLKDKCCHILLGCYVSDNTGKRYITVGNNAVIVPSSFIKSWCVQHSRNYKKFKRSSGVISVSYENILSMFSSGRDARIPQEILEDIHQSVLKADVSWYETKHLSIESLVSPIAKDEVDLYNIPKGDFYGESDTEHTLWESFDKSITRPYSNCYKTLRNECKKGKRMLLLDSVHVNLVKYNIDNLLTLIHVFWGVQSHSLHPLKDVRYVTGDSSSYAAVVEIEEFASFLYRIGMSLDEVKDTLSHYKLFSLEDYDNFLNGKRQNFQQAIEYSHQVALETYKPFHNPVASLSDKMEKWSSTNKAHETEAEKNIRLLLESTDIVFERQRICSADGHFYILDFYLPKYNLCIEADGDYHYSQEMLMKDRCRDSHLLRNGVVTLRFTNTECLLQQPVIDALKRITCKEAKAINSYSNTERHINVT